MGGRTFLHGVLTPTSLAFRRPILWHIESSRISNNEGEPRAAMVAETISPKRNSPKPWKYRIPGLGLPTLCHESKTLARPIRTIQGALLKECYWVVSPVFGEASRTEPFCGRVIGGDL